MKKLLLIVFTSLFSLFFLFSCSQESRDERYFANCVKDVIKTAKSEGAEVDEEGAIGLCKIRKKEDPDEFKFYKGKVYSKKR